jgi:hypothetical protein
MDNRPSPPRRFTLADLMELVAGAAICFALLAELGFGGILLGLAGLLLVWSVRHIMLEEDRREARRTVLWLAVTSPLWGAFSAWCLAAAMVDFGVPLAGRGAGSSRGLWLLLVEIVFVVFAVSRVVYRARTWTVRTR